MKSAILLVAVLPLLLSLGDSRHQLDRNGLQRAILQTMNGTTAGRITRQVECRRVGTLSTTAPVSYGCVLRSATGSEHARVTVTGKTWRADWAPVSG